MRVRVLTLLLLAICTLAEAGTPTYTSRRITSGVSSPLFACHAPGDANRLFIMQRGGQIRIFDLATNTLASGNYLTLSGIQSGGEQGLLGMAFHPNYASTHPYVYVYFTNSAGDLQINRYTRLNADQVDAASAQTVLIIPHPSNSNHNGGWIGFNPAATGTARSYLHLAVGDGGSGNDPPGNAQNTSVLLGKMLRINVDADDFPADATRNYGIPAGNPFAGATAGADEIWSVGLRNPWRSSFDRLTGDIWIGDVGQSAEEEVNFEPANTPGRNYGWRKYEGNRLNFAGDPAIPNHTGPVHTYTTARAVIGGYRYRGTAMPALQGTYFFGDNTSSQIWSSTFSGTGTLQNVTEIRSSLHPGGGVTVDSVASFGENPDGEIYICDIGGEIFQIIPTLNISNASALAATTVGATYSVTLSGAAGAAPYSFALASGALPVGVSLSSAGVLSGSPSAAGNSNFTVRVTDSLGTNVTKVFTLTVNAAPSVTTPSLPNGNAGTAYNQSLAATGGTGSYTWSISAGALPANLSLSTAGVISGTPNTGGTFNFTVRVTDSVGVSATRALSITVGNSLNITTTSLPAWTVSRPYSQAVNAAGGTTPYTWSIASGTLPAGLTQNTGTGTISGTPTAAGSSTFTVRVTDAIPVQDTQSLSIVINAAPNISTTTLPNGNAGAAYNQTLARTGGTAPFTWNVSAGTLPAGLSLNGTSGALTGTPTAAGTSNFTARIVDAAGAEDSQALSLTITNAPQISTTAVTTGNIGVLYSYDVNASGNPAPTYSLTTAPAGMTINATSGVISWTPAAAGPASVTVQATNGTLPNATQSFTINVLDYGLATRPIAAAHLGLNTSALPATLSATNVFTNLNTLATNGALIPYTVNTPLWSDAASKSRWISVPNNGAPYTATETIGFAPEGEWTFPGGTLLVKHFELNTDERNPSIRKRLETRLLFVNNDTTVFGVTYKWRDDNTNADLLPGALDEDITILDAAGTPRVQRWHYPSRTECLQCHTQNAGGVLGVKTRQQNGPFTYPSTGVTDNQLRTWNHINLFSTALNEANIPAFAKLIPLSDGAASLEQRVRSYIDANCSQCHRPNGAPALFDARFDTPLSSQGLINGAIANEMGVAGSRVVVPQDLSRSMLHRRASSDDPLIRMPPLGRNVVDAQAIAVIEAWIGSLTQPGAPLSPTDLIAVASSSTQIDLTWTDNASDESAYEIERAPDGATWTLIATLAANASSYADAGLAVATTYHYRVRAVNGLGNSTYAGPVSSTTMSGNGGGATPTGLRINFQPAGFEAPAEYMVDSGAVFGDRGGGTFYGWNATNSASCRDRNSPGSLDQRYDTLQHLQKPENPNAVWEIALTNGNYSVRVVSGDPSFFDSVYRTDIEGAQVLNATPSATQRWFEATVNVALADGRLTLTSGVGAVNNKICFIEIAPVTAQSGAFARAAGDEADSWIFQPGEATQITMAMLFTRAGSDSFRLKAKLPGVPTETVLGGQILGLDVGGAVATFTLDAKGRARSKEGSVRAKFDKSGLLWVQAALRKGQWTEAWGDAGLNKTTARVSVEIPFVITVGSQRFGGSRTLQYVGRKEKTGKAR